MSWSVYTVALPNDVKARVMALQPPGEVFAPRDDQVNAAKAAALALIDSGAIGDGEAFQVNLSGHANADHKPSQGYVNDTIGVTVYQTGAAAVTAFDQQQATAQKALE